MYIASHSGIRIKRCWLIYLSRHSITSTTFRMTPFYLNRRSIMSAAQYLAGAIWPNSTSWLVGKRLIRRAVTFARGTHNTETNYITFPFHSDSNGTLNVPLLCTVLLAKRHRSREIDSRLNSLTGLIVQSLHWDPEQHNLHSPPPTFRLIKTK
jgi:hypothetical protein